MPGLIGCRLMCNDKRMLELKAGDIVLVRGRSLRYTVARFLLWCKWNHAVVYYKDGEVQELNWHGTERKSFDVYRNKQIVVLRCQRIDVLFTLRLEAAFLNALNELQVMKFDWVEYVRRCLRLKPRNRLDRSVCDAYINQVYHEAGVEFESPDFKTIDCIDLMRKDYTESELLRKYNLTKVYDYRDEPK